MIEKHRLFNDTMRALAFALDMDEGVKLYHGWRVGVIAYEIGGLLDPALQPTLFWAGLLHDIGAVGLQDHVVHHAADGFRADDARQHPLIGARILRPLSLLESLADTVAHHHERIDGNGFPLGLRGDQVPQTSNVLLAADILEVAMRSAAPADRLPICSHNLRSLSDGACRHDIMEAAERVFRQSPELVDTLYDEHRLRQLVQSINPTPAMPPGVSRKTVLAQMLWVISRVVDAKHTFTMGHSVRVAFYGRCIAQALGGVVNEWDVVWAGLLHDVGNLAVPRAVLAKRGRLEQEDWIIVRQHALRTREFIGSIDALSHLAVPASSNHEGYDGCGYPDGLAGEDIPLIGRILAYADAYDALSSNRPHRAPLDPNQTADIMRSLVGRRLDPHLAPIALPVLESARGDVEKQASAGLAALLDSDAADLTVLLGQLGAQPVQSSCSPQGALLIDLGPWQGVSLSSLFWILSGADALREALPDFIGDNLLDGLDQPSASNLLDAATRLADGEVHTQYVFTAGGAPAEAVIFRKKSGFQLLLRSAVNRLQTMERMALFYRNFLSSMHGVAFLAPDGRILDVNRTFLNMYGMQLRNVVGNELDILSEANDAPQGREILAQSSSVDGSWRGELLHRAVDGREMAVDVSVSSVRDSNAVCIGHIAQFLDVTDRHAAEQELKRRKDELETLNRFKSDLMAITSHDIRSPLASVTSAVELLRSQIDRLPPERVNSYLDRIADASRQVLRMVEDILDLEKAESGRLQIQLRPVRIESVLARCVESVATQYPKLSFKTRIVGDPQPVQVDAARMEQVFTNLLGNAAKFAPKGSDVVAIYDCESEGFVRILVEDAGPGIPPTDLDSIFDRYYQVERNGSVPKRGFGVGLGLTIVKTIVTMHEGTVHAENREDQGCRFVIELPANTAHLTSLSALVIAATDAYPERIAELLSQVDVSTSVAGDFAEAERLLDYEQPALIVVFETVLSRSLLRLLQKQRGADARHPIMVCVRQIAAIDSELFHHELVAPVVDVELYEIVKEIRLRS